jgi:oligopeptide transport system ATP-binding protein
MTEALKLHLGMNNDEAKARAIEMLQLVGVPNADDRLTDYPHQFSGGQRQRIMIAMALACNPSVLIADEPTTALDVTIQAQITDLVKKLQEKLGMAVIWITHDLGVVAGLVDKVAVMYGGFMVETAPVNDLYKKTSHPYTKGLLESLPSIKGHEERLIPIEGSPPDLMIRPINCPFAPRCRYAIERCWEEIPPLFEAGPDHYSACWRWEEVRFGAEA